MLKGPFRIFRAQTLNRLSDDPHGDGVRHVTSLLSLVEQRQREMCGSPLRASTDRPKGPANREERVQEMESLYRDRLSGGDCQESKHIGKGTTNPDIHTYL